MHGEDFENDDDDDDFLPMVEHTVIRNQQVFSEDIPQLTQRTVAQTETNNREEWLTRINIFESTADSILRTLRVNTNTADREKLKNVDNFLENLGEMKKQLEETCRPEIGLASRRGIQGGVRKNLSIRRAQYGLKTRTEIRENRKDQPSTSEIRYNNEEIEICALCGEMDPTLPEDIDDDEEEARVTDWLCCNGCNTWVHGACGRAVDGRKCGACAGIYSMRLIDDGVSRNEFFERYRRERGSY